MHEAEHFQDFYNRIGQYDFTKPEQPKEIERLSDDIRATFVINDKHVKLMRYDGDNKWSYMCYPKEFIDKINELVDAVNGLRGGQE